MNKFKEAKRRMMIMLLWVVLPLLGLGGIVFGIWKGGLVGKTVWLGHMHISGYNEKKEIVSGPLNTYDVGLRDDGVLVWRPNTRKPHPAVMVVGGNGEKK